ncbi:MAG TPA: MBL fold metallo-hydrolase, partial [Candidatus Limnocylindrales bacterium]
MRIEPVVTQAEMPPGVLGPDPATLDVRCFVVSTPEGIVLIDAGLPGSSGAIEATLVGIGGRWSDVTDIVLTHAHFDHVGGLAEAAARSPGASLWAGSLDVAAIPVEGRIVRPVAEGDRVRGLEVLDTPGHTPGHISLLDEAGSVVILGDLVGSVDGALSFGPPAFTADPDRSRKSLERVVALRV